MEYPYPWFREFEHPEEFERFPTVTDFRALKFLPWEKERWRTWLTRSQEEFDFPLEDILPEPYRTMIRLYLLSPATQFPSQQEVQRQIDGTEKIARFSTFAKRGLRRVKRRVIVGHQAIEYLKPDRPIYGEFVHGGIHTLDWLARLDKQTVRDIVYSDANVTAVIALFHELQERQPHGIDIPDWPLARQRLSNVYLMK